MNSYQFHKSKYSEIMTYKAWKRISESLPENRFFFTRHGCALLASMALYLLIRKGYPSEYIGKPEMIYNETATKIEIQSNLDVFTLFNIWEPQFPITLEVSRFEEGVKNAGGRIVDIRELDDLLTFFDDNSL